MKKVALALLCVLLLAVCARAELKIEGGRKVKEYTLGKLEAAGISDGAKVQWQTPPALSVAESGRTLIFTGPPGTYRVRVLAVDFKSETFEESSITVVIQKR